MRKLLGLVMILLLILTACSGDKSEVGMISSLAAMPNGIEGPTVTADTGTSVEILFTTGVPTMCNVAYGTTSNYGRLATMSMMGGAVREHAVTLTGLEPETLYHYRINLTDEAANLYQSQDLTFTTATAEQSTVQEGLDLGAAEPLELQVLGVSSNFGGAGNDENWGANRAIDGDPGTAWSSDGDGDNAWIEVALGETSNVQAVGFWTRTMANDTAQIFRFTVTTDQGESFGPFELPNAEQLYTFPVEFTASTVRFDAVETNTGNTGAVEIEVYALSDENTP